MGFYLVIPAAGAGSRMGGETKQFRMLGDKPVFIQAIRPFLRNKDLQGLIISTSDDAVRTTQSYLDAENLEVPFAVIVGGSTRQESVFLALSHVGLDAEIVLIHDAVRPFVDNDLIDRVLDATRRTGGACPAVPVADTLRRVSGGFFGETVDRTGIYRSQTPQGFRTAQIIDAHKKGVETKRQATDDVELYREFIGPVAFVDGSSRNFKITRNEDWDTATQLWSDESKTGMS